MKKNLLVLASLLLLFSCSDEKLSSAVDEPVGAEDLTERSAYNITYDNAVKMALTAPQVFETTQTKGGERTVDECLPILSGALTKGGSADTLVYLINYADGQGYTFIPKDGRKGDYLAFVANGSFNVADTATNELTKFLYKSIVSYCLAEVPETKGSGATYDGEFLEYEGDFGAKTGSGCSKVGPAYLYYDRTPTYIGRLPNVGDYYYTKGCVTTLRGRQFDPNAGVEPLLTTSWGQGYPFNEKSPMIDGQRAWAGCVATAISQVIAYHNFPANYPQGTIIDGSDNSGKVTMIHALRTTRYANKANQGGGPGFRDYSSRLYRYVGDIMGNSWGLSGTGAVTAYSYKCFKALGYSSAPQIINYDRDALTSSLDQGWPVIIRGADSNGGGGHAWVIDGYRFLSVGSATFYFDENGRFDFKTPVRSAPNIPLLYVNCNFGWDGSSNGFYLDNVFNTGTGAFIETKYDFVGTQIIVNIHP